MSIFRRRTPTLDLTVKDVFDDHRKIAEERSLWLRERFLVVRENGEWIAYARPTKARAWALWRYTKLDPGVVEYRELSSPFKEAGDEQQLSGP